VGTISNGGDGRIVKAGWVVTFVLCNTPRQKRVLGVLLEKSEADNTAKVDVGGSNWMHLFYMKELS